MHRLPRRLESFAAAAFGAIALLAHCGGSDLMLPSGPTVTPTDITIVKGDAQIGTPGTMLRDSIVVEVTDSLGVPLAEQRVEFAPDAPGAAVTPQSSLTGTDGRAGARWVLGETTGPQEVVARVIGEGVPDSLQIRFTASAEAVLPAPSRLMIRTEPSSSVTTGVELDRQPEVQIQDEKGKDVNNSGVSVTAAIASGAGTLGGTTTRLTNSKGRAEFTNLKIQGATGSHVLIFAASGYTSVTSSPIEVQLPANQAPRVAGDEYNTTEGHDRTLAVDAANGVLHNDQDPEGGQLTAAEVTGAPNGTVTVHGDGSFTYNPDANFFGDDRFTYRATDPTGKSSTATVTIHVAPVNDAPWFTLNVSTVVVYAAGGISQAVANFAGGLWPGAENEADQVLTFEVIGNSAPWLFAAGPTVTRDPLGNTAALTFTPAVGLYGASAVTIVLKDNGGTEFAGFDTSAPQTFTIWVQ